MNATTDTKAGRIWNTAQANKAARIRRGRALAAGKVVDAADSVALLEAVLEPGDRVCIEGDNQKHADYLAAQLARVDPAKVHDLHIVQSNLALPPHLDIFDKGIARKLDFSYSGPQGVRVANLIKSGKLELGAIHTYLELYSRYFLDLSPRAAVVVAVQADRAGNLYTGSSTEDTPVIVEAAAFRDGVVIAQVNEIVDTLPRVDIPGDWVDFVVKAPKPFYMEPIFTRDPAQITEIQILMAMMALKGVYEPYGVTRLNHGIGFSTAAIELILPTYGERLGLKGKVVRHLNVNPHPTLIPAIETGWIGSIHAAGTEVGMDAYIAARPDVFFCGPDGSMRSNRVYCQLAGHYADMFIGGTLQIDVDANSSTATRNRMTGFGGAPNYGCESRSRRHVSPAWLKAGREARGDGGELLRGRKLVVQMVETYQGATQPTFVERLDAWNLMEDFQLDLPPIMIYGEDMTHIVTEEGIANLLLCRSAEEREQAVRGVAGFTPVGLARDRRMVENLRDRGAIRRPDDLGIDPREATRDLLAARSVKDLVRWSGGLYDPPKKFRNW